MAKVTREIMIENAEIRFRNFGGAKDQYNPNGKRSFVVLLNLEDAADLIGEGWNVKYLKPLEEGDAPRPYLNVEVKYGVAPPVITVISGHKKTRIDEETVGMLDWAEIENVDLIIRPYNWSMSGKTGVKAYLKKMYVMIKVDKFEEKYADFEDNE